MPGQQIKKKNQVEFDELRKSTTWGSDPRWKEEQWPCHNKHILKIHNNKWGRWEECSRCNLRTSYPPAASTPASSCNEPLPAHVTSALERLRQMGWTPESLDGEEHDQAHLRRSGGQPQEESQSQGNEQGLQDQSSSAGHRGSDVRQLIRRGDSGQGSAESCEGQSVNAKSLEPCVGECQVLHMAPSQKSALGSSVSSNWATVDSSQALRDLKGHEGKHLWEICCSPTSALSEEMKKHHFKATRHNYESGFDLGNKQKVQALVERIPEEKPTRIWASPRCTAVTSIQNLNQRTEAQRRDLYKKRLRTIREFRNLVDIFKAAYSRKPGSTHLYMEWPKSATVGWRLKEWELLRKWLEERFSQKLYWTEIHGCMHGLQVKGEYVNKPWYVLTTDFDFFCSATIKCDGSRITRSSTDCGYWI